MNQQQDLWPFIASIIYSTVWSLSLYPQVYDNYKLKSVQGFSLSYLVLNISGFTFYGLYSSIGYFTNIKGAGTVVLGDILFVYHALLIICIQTIQVFYYPKGKNRVSGIAITICIILWALVLIQWLLTVKFSVFGWLQYWNPVSSLGYCKIVISFIKYTPAAYWNYQRKSTIGWPVSGIFLDLTGGIFSFASGSISIDNGLNISKLILAVVSMFYDLIFLFQHYILYRHKPAQNVQALQQQQQSQQVYTKTK